MEIDIYIDVMTNCLVLAETGEECDTEYRLVVKRITKRDAKGLFFTAPLHIYYTTFCPKEQGWHFWRAFAIVESPNKDGGMLYGK